MGFRVFVSAVTKELGEARLEIARVLRRKGIDVEDQAHFAQGGGVLLDKLRDYIAKCDAVVCLIGDHTGVFPTPEHAAAVAGDPTFARYAAATGASEASTTQWEFLLAKTLGKPAYVFIADPAFPRRSDKLEDAPAPSPDDLAAQTRFKAWVKQTGEDRDTFKSLDKLREDVLVLPFPDLSKLRPRSPRFVTIGSLFKGREADIARLRAALGVGGGGRARIDSRPASLHGLGGVGKTQLAIEFGLAHEDQFDALLFITADSSSTLETGLANLAGVLELPEQAAREDEVKVRAVLNWLAARAGWYLVIDNVDDEATAKAVEARLAGLAKGILVVTSRLANWSKLFTSLYLDVLSPEASVEFLLESTGSGRISRADDEALAATLASDVDHLALALEIAAGFIAARRITVAAYRDLWRDNQTKVNAWYAARPKGEHDYPRSVDTTWLTSFVQLSERGQRLLERLAWLAPDPIPRFLFDDADEDSLEELVRYSLVSVLGDESSPGGDVTVHRLLQTVMRDRQGDGAPAALRKALEWIGDAFPKESADVRFWDRAEPLAPHAATVSSYADQAAIAFPTSVIMDRLATFWQFKARWADAELLFRRALATAEASCGPAHSAVATGLNNLASLLQSTNRLEEAEPLYRRALTIAEANFGSEHPILASHLNNLASLLQYSDRLAEAESLYRRALAISEASFDAEHPCLAIPLNNLASLLQATNRLAEAELLQRKALAIDKASYGPDHPEVAKDINNLALLLQTTNRLTEAEPLFRRALAITEASYGPEHPEVAIRLNNLASLLLDTNRLAEAEPLFRRALAVTEASYGSEHPNVAAGLNNLALLLRATNRLSEAEPLYRRGLAICELSYGSEHPEVATHLNNLASFLQDFKRLAEAEPLFRRALGIYEASYGADHPKVAICLSNLALILRGTNRLAEAAPLFRRALAITEASYGFQHPEVATHLNNLASLLQAANKSAEAELLFRRALAIDEASPAPDHPNVAIRLNNFGLLLQSTNRLAEAEPLSRRHLLIFLKFMRDTGHRHPHLDTAISNYSDLLSAMGLDQAAIQARLAVAFVDAGLPPPSAPPDELSK